MFAFNDLFKGLFLAALAAVGSGLGIGAGAFLDFLRPDPMKLAEPHLRKADADSRKQADDAVRAVDEFFEKAKSGAPAFAESALGWGSKWRLAQDKVGISSGVHDAYLKRKFEEHLFSGDKLGSEIESAVKGFMQGLNSAENEMLVRLRKDIEDIPALRAGRAVDSDQLLSEINRSLEQSSLAAAGSLKSDVVKELASLVAGEVLAFAAVRIGVSAGVIGAGAASSWATFGIGMLAGLIIDQVICVIWDAVADPVGDLTRKIESMTEDIRNLIIDGQDGSGGLRISLEKMCKERDSARRKAVETALSQEK